MAGFGVVTTALLPAVQAPLSDRDNAASTAAWVYVRSYGAVWGIAIPVTVFNNEFGKRAHRIGDPAVRAVLFGENAYGRGTKELLSPLSASTRRKVVAVYVGSLRIVWIASAAICAASTLLILFGEEIALRTELDTKYGLKDDKGEERRGRAGASGRLAQPLMPCVYSRLESTWESLRRNYTFGFSTLVLFYRPLCLAFTKIHPPPLSPPLNST